MDADVLSVALKAVDEALAAEEAKRPPAPTREPDTLTPFDLHIQEMHQAMLAQNEGIALVQSNYADAINASRAKLEAAQNELRVAERELAARWHGSV